MHRFRAAQGRIILATSVMLLSWGCTTSLNVLPTLTPETLVEPDNGIVVARVINTGPFPLPFNQLTINPQNLNQSAEVKAKQLTSLRKQLDGSTVFASPVKQGVYSLNSLQSFHTVGDGYYSNFVSADVKFGTFDVKAGEVTDLGTIVYYPKPAVDKYVDTLVLVPDTVPGESLDAHFPFQTYDSNNLLTWNDDGFAEERRALFLSIVQNPVTHESSYQAPDGSLLFLAKLGVIIQRYPNGEWDIDAVDTNLDLFAVAQNEAGDRIVGGSEGRIFWKPAGGQWRDVSLDRSYHVDALEFGPDGRAIVLARQLTSAAVFAAGLSQAENEWQELNRYDSQAGWTNATVAHKPERQSGRETKPKPLQRIAHAALSTFEGKRYIKLSTHPTKAYSWVFASSKTHAFVYDPATWVITATKKPKDVFATTQAGAIEMAIELPGFWSWSGKPVFRRWDESSGDWEKISTHVNTCDGEVVTKTYCGDIRDQKKARSKQFTFHSAPWFKNSLEAVAIVSYALSDFWSGKQSMETRILSTNDGGKVWTDTGYDLPKEFCTAIIPEVTDRLLLSCNGATGDFFESFDDAATWRQVREHQDF